MITKQISLNKSSGLHARPAIKFIKKANKFKSQIYIEYKNKSVDAKSLIGLLSLGVSGNSDITLSINGDDEEAAMVTLTKFLEDL